MQGLVGVRIRRYWSQKESTAKVDRPALVKAAPPTARNREVEELKEECEIIESEREARSQQVERDREFF